MATSGTPIAVLLFIVGVVMLVSVSSIPLIGGALIVLSLIVLIVGWVAGMSTEENLEESIREANETHNISELSAMRQEHRERQRGA